MRKIQISGTLRTGILFVSILFLFSGCVSAPKPEVKKGVLDDVLVFRDLQQVDLDNDGVKDIVAIYDTPGNLSGVKVIKFHNSRGEVVYHHIFDTPNVKFAMKGATPVLIVESKPESAGCAGRLSRSIYHWDGGSFRPAARKNKTLI